MVIQFRRGTPPDNYVLKDGEPGWDSQNKIFKMGDGTTTWGGLPSISGLSESAIVEAITDYLTEHPIEGATQEYVAEAVQAHREEVTPHSAYDVDMPKLTLLFENGLV